MSPLNIITSPTAISEKLVNLSMKIKSPTFIAGFMLSVGIVPEVKGSQITGANIGKNMIAKANKLTKIILAVRLFMLFDDMFYFLSAPVGSYRNRFRKNPVFPTCRARIPLSHHAASTHGIAPARRARLWIPYGPSEQSRWAPQLGQRSWHACMSIIVCPHMGHSFFLSAVIHHAQGSASYYSFWQARRLRPSGLCAPAPGSPPVCLDSRCTL